MDKQQLISEIQELKKQRDAVILAHNYVDGDLQDLADYTGDSLELAFRARDAHKGVIVCCGVSFMGETAKILSPESRVLLPVPSAGCPMADMVTAEEVRAMRKAHPGAVFICYVNSSAEVKSEVDICCTSANAAKIVASVEPGREIVFLPDGNLGRNVEHDLKRPIHSFSGYCPVHNQTTVAMIERARALHPGAKLFVHPECPREVVAAADEALSTGGMLRYVAASPEKQFIVGTEKGILHRLVKENPGKEFFPMDDCLVCADMKKLTLESVRDALRDLSGEVLLSKEIMDKARKPIAEMLERSKA
ncbi:MAG: quinolinate synthase NadA [Victivallaceae bacterium]|nr:quinolinate synthase NadA [Victivallaceae bacterium]